MCHSTILFQNFCLTNRRMSYNFSWFYLWKYVNRRTEQHNCRGITTTHFRAIKFRTPIYVWWWTKGREGTRLFYMCLHYKLRKVMEEAGQMLGCLVLYSAWNALIFPLFGWYYWHRKSLIRIFGTKMSSIGWKSMNILNVKFKT